MSNSYFAFKQFTVFHDRCAMKVGTDGVLLGAWAETAGKSRILDAGTGCGLIALMMAQRSAADIDAVEIDENAASQAEENIRRSPWHDRIRVYYDSLQHFAQSRSAIYDLIISNPPFFRNSLKSPSGHRSIARHNVQLTYEDLLHFSRHLLQPTGTLNVIIPASDKVHFCELADFNGMSLSRITWVEPFPGKEPSRCMMSFGIEKQSSLTENEMCIRSSPGKYSEEYVQLTEQYYLNRL